MSTGDAIIVSTLVIMASLAAWRISIANRWGTVGKVIALIFLILLIIFGAFQAYDWYQKRPRPVDNLNGIRIGMSEPEVLVKMGKASDVNSQKKYKILSYTKEYNVDYRFDVSIWNGSGKVDVVCEKGDFTDPYLSSYTSENEITERFGKPENTVIDPNGSYKSLSYPLYNLTFIIRLGDLSEVCLANKAQGYLA